MLSPDSSARDRRDKASNYVRLRSLQAYLVVDPDQPRVELLSAEDGVWTWQVFGPGMELDLDGWALDVDQMYGYLDAVAE